MWFFVSLMVIGSLVMSSMAVWLVIDRNRSKRKLEDIRKRIYRLDGKL